MSFITILHSILDIIEAHGFSIVVAVGALMVLSMVMVWVQKKFDQMWNLVIQVKNTMPPMETSVEKVLGLNSNIRGILTDMMVEMDADWCQLWQFHNGAHGVGRSRIPFMFLSLTHEVCKSECEPMRSQMGLLPLSLFDEMIKDLITKDILTQIYRPGVETTILKMMHDHSANLALLRALRDEDNAIIGFVGTLYKSNRTLIDKRKSQFLNGSQRMAALLASFPEGTQTLGK